jgi:PST family polysaccharide transporter
MALTETAEKQDGIVLPVQGGSSYKQILKSSAVIGGSSIVNILLGIVRTKAMAMLLGPAGIGLMGTYNAVTDMVRAVAGMGVGDSGVRQIAEGVGTGNQLRIARSVVTLRRVVFVLGVAGALVLFVFSGPVCRMTFGNTEHVVPMAVLSITILFAAVTGGQAALIQGMRQIGNLARISVIGGVVGTVFSIPIVYFLGERGIVPSLVCVSAMSIVTSWWYARKIRVASVAVKWAETWSDAVPLLRLGFVFLAGGVMSSGVAYLARAVLVRWVDLEGVGLYQAASTLAGLYIDFILQAMARDFYPRLTATRGNAECNRMVNEQTEVGLLLATPGILATLSFTPLLLGMFYTPKFAPAADILRWMVLGLLLRVAAWPMLIILPAKGESKLFFWAQFAANAVYAALIFICVRYWGLVGIGVASAGFYLFYAVATFVIVRRLSGFAFSAANLRLGAQMGAATLLVFGLRVRGILTQQQALATGALITLAIGIYSLRRLYSLGGKELFDSFLSKMLNAFCRAR